MKKIDTELHIQTSFMLAMLDYYRPVYKMDAMCCSKIIEIHDNFEIYYSDEESHIL